MRGIRLMFLFASVPLAAAGAAHNRLTIFNGSTIDTPPVASMSCEQLSDKLSEIDETGYRGNSPTPRHAQDLPLLAYEEKAATAYYERCVIRALGGQTPSAAFDEGYRGEN